MSEPRRRSAASPELTPAAALRQIWTDIGLFARHASGLRLRSYQLQAAEAIVNSVLQGQGLSFVVIFPRQSGKNELQAQIEAFLLARLHQQPAEMVKVSPTWKPQSLNAMRRLERVLRRNLIAQAFEWSKEQGYIYRIGQARLYFLSGAPGSNIVGATASTLLEIDEAQDISLEKFDKEINPMAASTNATRAFFGTAWTADTLLGREMRFARQQEAQDGIRRLFLVTADEVRREVPAYGRFVDAEIARLGRSHPFVRTQYFCEEITEASGMFPPERLALMQGRHPRQLSPQAPPINAAGEMVAFLLDVGGEESAALATAGPGAAASHDATALTIVAVQPSPAGNLYCVLDRRTWSGIPHTALHAQLLRLAEVWRPYRLVIDATGLGAGLAAFLRQSLGEHLILPFVFTQKSKSDLGWQFLSIIETGRFQDYADPDDPLRRQFLEQACQVQAEILPGPGRVLRWGAPEPRHDDLVLSAALCALLESSPVGQATSAVIASPDPLQGAAF